MMHKFLALFLPLLAFITISPAHAAEMERYTHLNLIPETYHVKAGDMLTVGIEQTIAPHWHTYWKNPGDSGAAPRVTWDLPAGWSVSEIAYPAPDKIEYGPLLNYGYSHHATLLQEISVPADYDGHPVDLTANIEVLVCKDICIPEYDEITLHLNDASTAQAGEAEKIAQARSKLPQPAAFAATYLEKDNQFILKVSLPESLTAEGITNAHFIPQQWGAVDNAAETLFDLAGQDLSLKQLRGEQAFSDFETLQAVLSVETPSGTKHYAIEASLDPDYAAMKAAVLQQDLRAEKSGTSIPLEDNAILAPSLLFTLLLAFAGGVVLNLMPCVFPVLSMKTLSLVKMAQHHPDHARLHGIAYTAGVVLSFLCAAGALIILQGSGQQVGWGFQLQNPLIVAGLAYLLFIVGLNLAGIFEIGHGLSNVGQELGRKEGLLGAFFTGALATLVAAPCTAPFMATAVGVAFTQPPVISLLIFGVLGFGLAFPYLLLSFVPALQGLLPKPGAWMRSFQQFLAFPMFLATTWLLWVLAQQVGDAQLFSVLIGLVALTFAFWAWPRGGWLGRLVAALSFGAALYGLPIIAQKMDAGSCYYAQTKDLTFGEEFSQSTLDYYLTRTDRPVFVEMTAAWCITCKLNHASSLDVDATRDLFAKEDTVFLVGDWTNQDSAISEYLHSFGRNGVPLYVFYPAPYEDGVRPDPVILPQLLTPSLIEKTIRTDYID